MAKLIQLKTVKEAKGCLSVIEGLLPGGIKRVDIYSNFANLKNTHRLKSSIQIITCLTGVCKLKIIENNYVIDYILDTPDKCVILHPEDWREFYSLENATILLSLTNRVHEPIRVLFGDHETVQVF